MMREKIKQFVEKNSELQRETTKQYCRKSKKASIVIIGSKNLFLSHYIKSQD